MKIGVITFWHGKSNYGMLMQCWALQTYLKQIGHEPYIIRYAIKPQGTLISKILKLIGLYDVFRNYKCKLRGQPIVDTKANNRKRRFSEFIDFNIECSTQRYYTIDELRQNPPIADCYITGSDQVWAQSLNNINNFAYFLDFGPSNIKRVAYAPSFSMKEYPHQYKNILKEKLSLLDAISCREYDGVNICNELGYHAVKVLDPTLLLEKELYLKLCKNVTNRSRGYGFVYSLNIVSNEQIHWKELQKYSLNNGLRIIVTPSDGYLNGAEVFGDDVEYLYSTPQEWLASIRDAEFVVTPSFHGIAFSIILNKPFVYTPLSGAISVGNNRIIDLLSDLGLMDRILSNGKTYSDILSKKICWNSVNDKLTHLKTESIVYLQTQL